ncbi:MULTISPECIES: hypothetical protein [unclassified Roseobacter]|uniref:hypothetical protein n=1 Tax=unclassified Roseobacter TaxID=196798 RepID=UPI0018A26BFA|nr:MULTISPECIES: hypothetical protein [unclassified Roseobacter]MDW3182347.1 hypothetical protein [Roseobacter sp.]
MARFPLTLALILCGTLSFAQQDETPAPEPLSEPPMTLERLANIILNIDEDAQLRGSAIEFTIQDIPVIVVADPRADRMRAMVPIRSSDGLDPEELMRLMQANFDSALDARYAVARGRLWGVFIHPLSPLEQDQFLSALVQTVNVARTYGQTYSGGAQVFGGGDSNGIYQDLLDDLRKGQAL